jgi:serine/threonine protein kinase/WD40 repeat protein/tetratricopeptide (TPR) repeat protein
MQNCPSVEQLESLLAAQLSEAEVSTLSGHLEVCDACRQKLDRLSSSDGESGKWRHREQERRAEDGMPTEFIRRLEQAVKRPPISSLMTLSRDPGPVTPLLVPARPPEDYEILEVLGHGGMGVVYKARQRRLNRVVALKMLLHDKQLSANDLARFHAEAQAVARLTHPNIVQIYEVGEQPGQAFLALEFVDGPSLAEHLTGTPQPPQTAALLIETLARAMHYAHQQGVVHRDLKPANILLQKSEIRNPKSEISGASDFGFRISDFSPKITDFGLAKRLDEVGQTQTGQVLGTPSYMAPEQARGQHRAISPATDVYALGAILYQLLTGRPPFQGVTSLDTVMQVLHEEPVSPRRLQPGLSLDLNTICLKCLQKDPHKRYTSAAALADDLRCFREGRPIQARPVGRLGQTRKWVGRHPALAGLLLGTILSLLAGTLVSTYFALKASDRADQVEKEKAEVDQARKAEKAEKEKSDRQSADLLLDHSLALAYEGKVAEALPWMVASLDKSPDDDVQRLVRIHLATWGSRVPTLTDWLPTEHRRMAVSPDGRLLLTAGSRKGNRENDPVVLQFWDLHTGQPLGPLLPTPDVGIGPPAFSPDGQTILAGNGSAQAHHDHPGWARRWSVAERRLIGEPMPHPGIVDAVSWTPDGRRFVTADGGSQVRVWDANTGKSVGQPIVPPPGGMSELACSPDGRWLLIATATRAAIVGLDDPLRLEIPLAGITSYPRQALISAAFSADGKTILLGGGGSETSGFVVWQRWDPEGRRLLGKPVRLATPAGKVAVLEDGRVVLRESRHGTADGRTFVVRENGVQVWRAATDLSRPREELPLGTAGSQRPHLQAATLSADGTQVWACGSGMVQAWDLARGCPRSAPLTDRQQWNRQFVLSPDGKWIATSIPGPRGRDLQDFVQVWETATGRPVGLPLEHPNMVLSMAFSADSRLLACGGHVHQLHLWDVAAGQLVETPVPQGGIIMHIAFSPDGRYLAVGTYAQEVLCWDLTTRQQAFVRPHSEVVVHTCFSPDGRQLLTLCQSAAHLWAVPSGKHLGKLPYKPDVPEVDWPHCMHLRGLFSPDGKTVLVSSGFGSFRLWDTATVQPLAPPTPLRPQQLMQFAFSPDGRWIASGHEDGTAQLWDVATLRPVGAPVQQNAPVIGLGFRPDGQSYWTMTGDGSLCTWSVPAPLEGLVERIRLAVELTTGRQLDSTQSMAPLERSNWEERRRQWQEREGSTSWSLGRPPGETAWHEARARDAEQSGAWFTARWHLDRLLATRPDDWLLYARRARTHANEGRWDLAEADYAQARQREKSGDVEAWCHQEAGAAQARQQFAAARWYLDRLVAAHPNDWRLYESRAFLFEIWARTARNAGHTAKDVELRAQQEGDLARAIARDADSAFLCRVAGLRSTQGRWSEAVRLFARARQLGPLPPRLASVQALACLQAHDTAGYRAVCADLVHQAVSSPVHLFALDESVYQAVLLAPGGVSDYTVPLGFKERVAAGRAKYLKATDTDSPNVLAGHVRHDYLSLLGGVLHRAGCYQEAVDRLNEGIAAYGEGGELRDWAFLALAYEQLGRTEEARRWHEKVKAYQPKLGAGIGGIQWWDEVEKDILRREVLGQESGK